MSEHRRRARAAEAVVRLVPLLLLGGCVGELTTRQAPDALDAASETPEPTACSAEEAREILRDRCESCHSGSSPSGELDLSDLDDPLVWMEQPSSECSSGVILDGNSPRDSLLFSKLSAETIPAGCGVVMPPLGRRLDADEIECIGAWVDTLVRDDTQEPPKESQ